MSHEEKELKKSNVIFTTYLHQHVHSTSIEELTGTKHISSDQQRLPSNLRVERDNIDIGKVIFF